MYGLKALIDLLVLKFPNFLGVRIEGSNSFDKPRKSRPVKTSVGRKALRSSTKGLFTFISSVTKYGLINTAIKCTVFV